VTGVRIVMLEVKLKNNMENKTKELFIDVFKKTLDYGDQELIEINGDSHHLFFYTLISLFFGSTRKSSG